jgi:hypothetical protein
MFIIPFRDYDLYFNHLSIYLFMNVDQMVPGSGHLMLEVTIKAKAVAELLLLFNKSKKEQIYTKNEKKKNQFEEKEDTIASELFIRCLQSFLSIPLSSDSVIPTSPSILQTESFSVPPLPSSPRSESG